MDGGGGAGWSGDEADTTKKGLAGTGLELPENRHGNLKSASSDQNLKDLLLQIKSCKSPVSTQITNNPHFSFLFCAPIFLCKLQPIKPLSGFLFVSMVVIVLGFVYLFNSLQAVINYGASWYVSFSGYFLQLCAHSF